MNPTLVVLAAGMSTRYGRLKQLEPVGPSGEALLDYSVFDAVKAGFERVVLVIREELESAFRAHVASRWRTDLEVVYHHQELEDLAGVALPGNRPGTLRTVLEGRRKPWGTAHALLSARPHLPERFAVLNADDFYGESALDLAARLVSGVGMLEAGEKPVFGLIGYRLLDTLSFHGGVNRGVVEVDGDGDDSGWLKGVREILKICQEEGGTRGETVEGEEVALSNDALTSTNFWVFTPAIFPHLLEGFRAFLAVQRPDGSEPEFLIPTEVNRLLRAGEARVYVQKALDPFFGITHPEDWEWVAAGLQRLAGEGRYPSPLWGGDG